MIRKCRSCGKEMDQHLGLEGTCKNLQTALSALRALFIWARCDDLVPEHVEAIIKRTIETIGGGSQ